MLRTARQSLGGMIFHVLNRGNARDRVFADDADNAAFEKVLAETQAEVFVRILSDCLMPNHWHLVLWRLKDGDLGRSLQKLTTTHGRRWHLHDHSVGTGHLHQGTYKTVPTEQDDHLDRFCVTWNGTPYDRQWSNGPRIGLGTVFGDGDIPQNTRSNRFYTHGQSHALTTGSHICQRATRR